jgi:hypothetical protein
MMYLARISHKVTSKPERGTKTKRIYLRTPGLKRKQYDRKKNRRKSQDKNKTSRQSEELVLLKTRRKSQDPRKQIC